MADFQHLDSRVKGTIVNVYGPNSFLEKRAFIDFLNWTKNQSEGGSWVMGGDFNLISNLGEKKGGRQNLDKYQETFHDFQAQSSFVDLETGNHWYTWNNKQGGEHLMASLLDRFLVLENIVHGMGEIMADILPAT